MSMGALKILNIFTNERGAMVSRTIIRYLLFYATVIVTLSVVSAVLDIFFYYYSYGHTNVHAGLPEYLLYYTILYWIIFLLSIAYNWCINNLTSGFYFRIVIAAFTFPVMGLVVSRAGRFGFYIGEFRVLKNILVLMITGIIIELIRKKVVEKRNEKREMKRAFSDES